MSFRHFLALLAVLCVAATCALADDAEATDEKPTRDLRGSILTGNEHALWLIHPHEEDRYSVVARPVGESWKWIARQIMREELELPPAAAAAVEHRLHVMPRPQAHLMYTLDGQRVSVTYPSPENWPRDARPAALCAAEGLDGADAGSMAAVVPVPPSPPEAEPPDDNENTETDDDAEAPVEAEATDPPTDDPPPERVLGVFVRREGQWRRMGEIPARAAEDGRVLATVADGRMYVLISPAENGENRLFASAEEDAWEELTLTEPGVHAYAAGMFTLDDRPRMVLAVPTDEQDRLRIVLATWRPGQEVSIQPIRIGDEDFTVAADQRPLASQLGDQAAVLTIEDDLPALTTSDTGGRGVHHGSLDVFKRPPPDRVGREIMNYFMWGLAAALIIPLLFLRPKSAQKPFALPGTMRTGSLVKRLAAAVLDAVPFYVFASLLMLTQLPLDELRQARDFSEMWESLRALSEQHAMTTEAAYVLIASVLLYLAYCIFMELRFSATLGKMAMGLRVCGDEGRPPTLRGVLIRNISKIIETLWLMPVPVLLLWPLFNPNRQRIGDLLGRTAVVDARYRAPKPDQSSETTETVDHQQGPQTPPPPERQEDDNDENR